MLKGGWKKTFSKKYHNNPQVVCNTRYMFFLNVTRGQPLAQDISTAMKRTVRVLRHFNHDVMLSHP